jgi:hypothetical protein
MGFLGKSRHETPAGSSKKRGADEIGGDVQAGASEAVEEPSKDILLQVPLTEVHKVENGVAESVVAKGSLVAYGVTFQTSGASMMALEVNETRWWLRPDMATLKVAPMSYMLDVSQPGAGVQTFFCITFAEDTLPEAVGTFEGLLEEVTQYKESDKLLGDPAVAEGDFAIAQGLKFTNKAASGIHSMSCKVAGGILMSANAVSQRLMDHAAKVQAGSEPGAPRPVPGFVTASASMTRAGTKILSKTAGRVVNAAASVPVFLVDKLTGSGKPLKPGEELKPQSARSQVMTAGAVSFTVVYESLEQGAKLVLTGARDSTAGIVGHKYGPDAGKVAGDTIASAGHSVNAYTSYRNIAVRAIARKTAKTTAKRMLYNYLGKETGTPGPDFKAQAKASVLQQAKSMKKGPQQAQQALSGSGASQHHVMLSSHSARLGAKDGAPATAPQ